MKNEQIKLGRGGKEQLFETMIKKGMYKEKKYNYGMNSSANTEDCKILKKIHGLIGPQDDNYRDNVVVHSVVFQKVSLTLL